MFLGVNYPNPFSAETTIPFGVEMPGHATLHVFDVSGRLVRTLLDGVLPAGERSLAWDGRDDAGQGVASGFYVLRLSTPAGSLSRTVKVLR
jgi:flagellar hook assembly protein FlgD